jgi:outer membrane protein OmpA-like peptidoglycan-associated protein
MRIAKLEFTRGIADLGIQSRRDLRDLAGRLKSMPMYYLVVTGHARAEGDPEANKQLAQSRAAAAAEYLQNDGGIGKNRIRVIAAEPSGQDGDEQSVTFRLVQRSY